MNKRFQALAGALLACASVHQSLAQPTPDAGSGSASPTQPQPEQPISPFAPPPAADAGSGSASASSTPSTSTGILRLPDEVGNEVIEVNSSVRPPGSLIDPDPLSASDNIVDARQLSLRPHRRAEDLTQEVPGLFTVQHAGGGKAQQYFMRGFDLDHGTDMASFVDGVPVNAVSHAHGQGYTDLHFVIPETVDSVEATKGPYSPLVGDFATAGSMGMHVADHVDDSVAKVELGTDGHERAVVVDSPDLGPRWRAMVATEVFDENGPFIHPEDYDRMNAVAKATRVLDDGAELTTEAMAYSGTWNMSGVLPARAVCGESDGTPVPAAYAGSHCLNRFDSLDPSQGGASQRFVVEETYRRSIPNGSVEASLFTLHSNLQLFPNDGIAAPFQPEGIRYGSQVEQDDARFESGAHVQARQSYKLLDRPLVLTYGLQLRNDVVASQLHRTEDRQRLDGLPGIPGPIEDSGINETESGAFVQAAWHAQDWLRVMAGGRADRIDADVDNEAATAVVKPSGYRGAQQGSPKAAVVVTPESHVDLFANFGQGFHTNDIRTVVEGSGTTLIARATGEEVGTTVRPMPGFAVSAVAFLLDLTSEETIDGDTASTTPSGPTRRYGTEETLRYQFEDKIYVEGTYTYAHSRFTDAADIDAGQSFVPLAPRQTLSASAGAIEPIDAHTTVYGSLTCRGMSDRYATQDDGTHGALDPLIATGFLVFNGQAGVRYDRYDFGLTVINIGNEVYREGQFAVQSRLPGEGPNPPVGISFTPGVPREFLASFSIRWR